LQDSHLKQLKTSAQCVGYCFHLYGAPGLKIFFDKAQHITQESLTKTIAELRETGLDSVAEICETYLDRRPKEEDIHLCPWSMEYVKWADLPETCTSLKGLGICNCLTNYEIQQKYPSAAKSSRLVRS
jgi:hypothetical protein